jgi:hypothetical protein
MDRKTTIIALLATNLLTLGLLAYLLLGGTTHTAPGDADDPRTVVYLTAGQRNLLLGEMRALLAATQGVMANLANERYAAAADQAESVGMRMAREVGGEHPDIIRKLPVEMRKLGFGVHGDFDALAEFLRGDGPDRDEAYRRIGETFEKCVACHATYRLGVNGQDAH